jgi:hypothetical protein
MEDGGWRMKDGKSKVGIETCVRSRYLSIRSLEQDAYNEEEREKQEEVNRQKGA